MTIGAVEGGGARAVVGADALTLGAAAGVPGTTGTGEGCLVSIVVAAAAATLADATTLGSAAC